MQEVARVILEAMNSSTPIKLHSGEWHIPYRENIESFVGYEMDGSEAPNEDFITNCIKVSTAMCAGVTYTIAGEDGKPLDYEKLIKRHDMLAENGHMSPFEHCAKSM